MIFCHWVFVSPPAAHTGWSGDDPCRRGRHPNVSSGGWGVGLSSCVEVVLSVVSQQSVSTEYTWGIIRDLPILHKAGAGAGLLVDPTTIWLQVDVHVEYHKGLLHFHLSRNKFCLIF